MRECAAQGTRRCEGGSTSCSMLRARVLSPLFLAGRSTVVRYILVAVCGVPGPLSYRVRLYKAAICQGRTSSRILSPSGSPVLLQRFLPLQKAEVRFLPQEISQMIVPTLHLAELEQNLTRLTYSCREKRKLGGTPRFGARADGSYDGEWHVCFDQRHRSSWRPPCTAFSFGLGGDWSFEEASATARPAPLHARNHLY